MTFKKDREKEKEQAENQ